ncbi:Hypothetical predicted protein [Drosophila guanche]|uniref:Uncharacterized protein n=1 Tax=Drosophila guanche TaxID=7266 RepID=A0A3B0JUG3_DROGU|nr:Hypothetical predicted protein [Drosophila guanche]
MSQSSGLPSHLLHRMSDIFHLICLFSERLVYSSARSDSHSRIQAAAAPVHWYSAPWLVSSPANRPRDGTTALRHYEQTERRMALNKNGNRTVDADADADVAPLPRVVRWATAGSELARLWRHQFV